MGKLTDQQKHSLREFLEQHGLSFKPLQDEMVDHMSCDLEDRMSQGLSFQDAWNQSITEIPNNHFQTIQKEIMDTINKRFTWSQAFSFFALGLLLISTLFKALHLQFAEELLLVAFYLIAGSLLVTSLSGIFLNKEKKGAIRFLGVILGTIILLVAFTFKILHLPGADELVFLAVILLVTSILVNTLHVYRHASGEGNLLTYLHERSTPGIERFLLILFFPLVIYKTMTIINGIPGDFIGNIILLVLIFGAGLQFLVLNWRVMEQNLHKRNMLTLIAIIVCSLCFVLPFLGSFLPFPTRVILITLFSPIAGWLAYNMDDETKKSISLALVSIVSLVFLGLALIRLSLIPSSYSSIFFNIPILLLLVIGVFLCRKHSPMRTYMLISVGGYLMEYIV